MSLQTNRRKIIFLNLAWYSLGCCKCQASAGGVISFSIFLCFTLILDISKIFFTWLTLSFVAFAQYIHRMTAYILRYFSNFPQSIISHSQSLTHQSIKALLFTWKYKTFLIFSFYPWGHNIRLTEDIQTVTGFHQTMQTAKGCWKVWLNILFCRHK